MSSTEDFKFDLLKSKFNDDIIITHIHRSEQIEMHGLIEIGNRNIRINTP